MFRHRSAHVSWAAYFVILMAWLTAQPVAAADMNLIITLDRADLQRRVERFFPITREDAMMSVQLHRPEVVLREGSDRIGLRLRLEATAGQQFAVSGLAQVDGKLRFERKRGEFYLDDARVKELTLDNIAPPFVEPVRQLAEEVVRQALQTNPIYALGQTGETKRFMGSEIKSATVQDGKLMIELSMR